MESNLLVEMEVGENCLQDPVPNLEQLWKGGTLARECKGRRKRKRQKQEGGLHSTRPHTFTSSFILPLVWSSDGFTVRFLQELSCDLNNQWNTT